MIIDAQATPIMAQDVIRCVRTVTDKPIRHLVLSRYQNWGIFDHCIPFNVARAYDECCDHEHRAHLDACARCSFVAAAINCCRG